MLVNGSATLELKKPLDESICFFAGAPLCKCSNSDLRTSFYEPLYENDFAYWVCPLIVVDMQPVP